MHLPRSIAPPTCGQTQADLFRLPHAPPARAIPPPPPYALPTVQLPPASAIPALCPRAPIPHSNVPLARASLPQGASVLLPPSHVPPVRAVPPRLPVIPRHVASSTTRVPPPRVAPPAPPLDSTSSSALAPAHLPHPSASHVTRAAVHHPATVHCCLCPSQASRTATPATPTAPTVASKCFPAARSTTVPLVLNSMTCSTTEAPRCHPFATHSYH